MRAIKVLYQGVVYLVSRFVKVIALIFIGAMAIGLFSILVGTHFGLPYLRLISPDPIITGYIAYYTGLIAFVIIPFLLLILLLSKIIWRHKRIHKYRYPIAGVWTVTAVIFMATVFFTARNFLYETSSTEKISETHIGQNRMLDFNINRLHDTRDHPVISLGNSYLSNGKLYHHDGIKVDFIPSQDDKIIVSRTTYARGRNYRSAVGNMWGPDHQVEVTDHSISLDDYYTLDRKGKFRGQKFEYKVEVPVGTELSFDKGSRIFTKRALSRWGYDSSQKWVMTSEGLALQDTTQI